MMIFLKINGDFLFLFLNQGILLYMDSQSEYIFTAIVSFIFGIISLGSSIVYFVAYFFNKCSKRINQMEQKRYKTNQLQSSSSTTTVNLNISTTETDIASTAVIPGSSYSKEQNQSFQTNNRTIKSNLNQPSSSSTTVLSTAVDKFSFLNVDDLEQHVTPTATMKYSNGKYTPGDKFYD